MWIFIKYIVVDHTPDISDMATSGQEVIASNAGGMSMGSPSESVLDGKLDSKQDAARLALEHMVDDSDFSDASEVVQHYYEHCGRPDSQSSKKVVTMLSAPWKGSTSNVSV